MQVKMKYKMLILGCVVLSLFIIVISYVYGYNENDCISWNTYNNINFSALTYSQIINNLNCQSIQPYQDFYNYYHPFKCLIGNPTVNGMCLYYMEFETSIDIRWWYYCRINLQYSQEVCRDLIYSRALRPQAKGYIDDIIEYFISFQNYYYEDITQELSGEDILE